MSRSAAPSRRLGRPPSIDSGETRRRILDAARRAFARRGYGATTNKDVADDVGITTGAIYHYFASKADLYGAVYVEVQEVLQVRLRAAVAPYGTLRERLEAALAETVEVNREDSSIAGFLVAVATEVERHPELAGRLAPSQGRTNAWLRELVAEAAANGELAPGIDAAAVADMLGAVLSGLARFSASVADLDRHRAATDAFVRLVDGTLLVASPPARRRRRAAAGPDPGNGPAPR